jgi:hypothetical protein
LNKMLCLSFLNRLKVNMADPIRHSRNACEGNPTGNNYFQFLIKKTKAIANKVSCFVYEIFRQIDNSLTARFYPKYIEIAEAVKSGTLNFQRIDRKEIDGLLFLKFFFRPCRWRAAVCNVESLYIHKIAIQNYGELSPHVFHHKTKNIVRFYNNKPKDANWESMSAIQHQQIKNYEFYPVFPKILDIKKTEELEQFVKEGLTPFLLSNFFKSISIENPAEVNINNLYLLLSILQLETELSLYDWQIDPKTFKITQITIADFADGSQTTNRNLKTFIYDVFTTDKIGRAIAPVLSAFEERYGFIEKDEHHQDVMKEIQDTGDV